MRLAKRTTWGLVLLPVLAHAAVILEGVASPVGEATGPTRYELLLRPDSARMNIAAPAREMSLLFRSDKGVLWAIDHRTTSYRQVTAKDVKAVRKRVRHTLDRMEEGLDRFPRRQRKAVLNAIEQSSPLFAAEARWKYRKVADGEQIGAWRCDRYEGKAPGGLEREIWTTDLEALALQRADFRALDRLLHLQLGLVSAPEPLFQLGQKRWWWSRTYKGLPVKVVTRRNGEIIAASVLSQVRVEPAEQTAFELPGGYHEQVLTDETTQMQQGGFSLKEAAKRSPRWVTE